MKRIFIVALCVALAVCALAVPASASTYEDRWTNVLDYVTVNNSGSNMLALKNGDSFKLDLTGNSIVHDIDIAFRFNSNSITGVKVIRDGDLSWNLTLEPIGEGFYRAFGSCGGYSFKSLEVQIFTNKGTQVIFGELLQCHISPLHVDSIAVGATVTKDGNVIGPATHSGSSAFAFSDIGDWFVSFRVEDWRQFDYINFGFTTKNITIGSITAKVGSRSVTVSIDSYDGDQYGSYQKMLSGYLDLVGIDHAYGNTLEIYVTGACTSTAGANLWLSWLRGQLTVDSPSIFALIWQSIKDGFKAVGDWLASGFNSVVNGIKEAFGGLADEQEQTNDILDGALNGSHESIQPDNSDVVGSVNDAESKLEADLNLEQSGNDYAIIIDDSVTTLLDHAFGFFLVQELLSAFIDISFFNGLLRLSVGIGLFAFATNIVQMASRSGGKSSKKGGGGHS